MIRSSLRRALRAVLDWADAEEEEVDARPTTPQPPEAESPGFIMTPQGAVAVPPGQNPIAFAMELARRGALGAPLDPSQGQHPFAQMMPPSTMRGGPTGSFYAMKEVDCSDMAPVEKDPEIQGLLLQGWEPFSVRKVSTPTGFEGVRVYLRKQLHS